MTPKQFRDAIELLGLNQSSAARFLGVTGRTARRWVAGDAPIPRAVELLICVLLSQELSPYDAQKIIDQYE